MNTLYSQRYLARLDRFLADHKVEIVRYIHTDEWRLALEDPDLKLQQAPFTQGIAIRWEPKEIHTFGSRPWPHVVHEAGHLLCSSVHPNHKDASDISFLGWELAAVTHLGLPWDEWHENNREYGVGYTLDETYYDEIGDFKRGSDDFRRFVADYIEDARKRGMIAADGTPLALR